MILYLEDLSSSPSAFSFFTLNNSSGSLPVYSRLEKKSFFSSLEYTGSDPLELFNVKNENADGEDDRFYKYQIIFKI